MEPKGRAPEVLLVDDEEEFLEAAARALGRRGLQVSCVTSAEAGLFWIRHRRLDVLILDVRLRGTDGLELLRRARAEDPSLEVVLLTGQPSQEDAVRGLGLGAIDYLGKPPDIEKLVETVRRACQRRRAGPGSSPSPGEREPVERPGLGPREVRDG